MSMSDSYLIPELVQQCVDNIHNNETHLSSVVTHVETVGRHTLYPWPRQIPFGRYDDHGVSQSYFIFQIYHCPFQKNFCFVHFLLGI